MTLDHSSNSLHCTYLINSLAYPGQPFCAKVVIESQDGQVKQQQEQGEQGQDSCAPRAAWWCERQAFEKATEEEDVGRRMV